MHDGAVSDQTVLTCSGGVATGEGTTYMADEERRLVRGLAVWSSRGRRKVNQGCTCCVRPGLNTVVRVEFMAHQQVPDFLVEWCAKCFI